MPYAAAGDGDPSFLHQAQWTYLQSCLAQQRFSHAWIFYGDQGIGKAAFAIRMAAHLLQHNGDDPASEPDEILCQQLIQHRHPDFLYLAAHETEKGTITIDLVRRIGPFIQTKPAASSYKVVVIETLDALNVNAANALLKVLEDPPSYVVYFLVAHQRGRVLPTILSRCQRLHFSPLTRTAFQQQIPDEHAPLLYALTNGNVSQARDLCAVGGVTFYEQCVAALMEVLTRDNHRSFMSLYEQAEKAIADKAGLLMLDVLACVMEAYVFSVVGTQKRLLLPAEEKLFDKMDQHRLLNILDCLSAVQEKKQLIQTLHFDVTQILINTLTSFKNCSTIETACR